MSDWLIPTFSAVLFLGVCVLLAMWIRHFIPLIRGLRAPLSAYALGPVIFFSDRYLNEDVRPHRKKCLIYFCAFAAVCILLVFGLGR